MAGYYDDQLKVLHQKMLRKQHLDKVLEDLYLQRQQLSQRIDEYKEDEQEAVKAVKKLEGTSLKSLIAGVRGNKEAKLEEARQRVQKVRMKIQTMDATMDSIYNDSMKCREEMKGMDNCVEEYVRVYKEKKAAIKASGSEAGDRLMELEVQISELEEQLVEMEEAAAAGRNARETAGRIKENLTGADSWATWDLFGGGILADAIKHDKMDMAQREVESLQSQLQTFRAELIDVKFTMDYNFTIDGFMRFADWFFDGLFVDWAVKDQIGKALQQADYTIEQIEKVQKKLYEIQDDAKKKLETAKKEVETLVDSVSM